MQSNVWKSLFVIKAHQNESKRLNEQNNSHFVEPSINTLPLNHCIYRYYYYYYDYDDDDYNLDFQCIQMSIYYMKQQFNLYRLCIERKIEWIISGRKTLHKYSFGNSFTWHVEQFDDTRCLIKSTLDRSLHKIPSNQWQTLKYQLIFELTAYTLHVCGIIVMYNKL